MNLAFFAAKAGQRDKAIESIKKIIKNNIAAAKRNDELEGGSAGKKINLIREERNIHISKRLLFFEQASDKELKQYLEENEQKALTFLRTQERQGDGSFVLTE